MRSYYCVVSTVDEIICQDVQDKKNKNKLTLQLRNPESPG